MKRRDFTKILGTSILGGLITPKVFAESYAKKTDYEICKKTWEQLCGKIGKVYKTDAFKYVNPVRRKPNVLIYGDSISIGYSSTVRKILEEKATVIRLFKNGGASHNFIPNMDKMQKTMFQPDLKKGWKFKWDIIHFNVGLHDLKYLKGKHLNKNGKQVSSIEKYKTNLEEVCNYLNTNYPKATLIFATTTPVPENAKGRFADDSIKFNKAALEVLENHPNIAINDLYTFTKPNRKQWEQEPGNVHYNELGKIKQGKKVAEVIAKYL